LRRGGRLPQNTFAWKQTNDDLHEMKHLSLIAFLCASLFWSCEVSVNTNTRTTVEGETVSSDDGGGLTGAVIKNDIHLEAKGVKVAQAYLMTEDLVVMPDNNADVNQIVYLTVKTDTGWVKINGKSFIGISERITDSNGNVIVDGEDLMKAYDAEGLDAEVAKIANATAVITEKSPSGNNDFDVTLKIWDKKGPGVIEGSYKLHIR
jgi:hypothetical protein